MPTPADLARTYFWPLRPHGLGCTVIPDHQEIEPPMTSDIHAAPSLVSESPTCGQCGRGIRYEQSFAFGAKKAGSSAGCTRSQPSELIKCFRCALQHRPMLKRSSIAALIVGTVLTALNQGDLLLSGQWNDAMFWKIPLTYCVPFCVATYGALSNSRK